ncbi:hypothetical protein N658DRAFT_489378 [Parathielavia hyrcaniae]|uniref:Endonuclease/exonuclease/phosphatase domain-containing protein n=1 Tax=Parathielavia hyrcaniae TaxID=113614 RepID=A0AAN6SY67_9PEZI|nr:hypothetical protein N658DRAFT_489378 [Parathielavia hyrcaniae]
MDNGVTRRMRESARPISSGIVGSAFRASSRVALRRHFPVNGIRNPFGYQPWRENRTFQETKIQRKDLRDDMVLVPGWDVYFSLPKYKKGYSGVAFYTRSSKCCPIRAEEGITGILCPPNSSTRFRDLSADCPTTRDKARVEFRQVYIDAIDIWVQNLVAMGKQVFLCGDLNIIRSELDTADLAERFRKEAMMLDDVFSTPLRRFFDYLVFGGSKLIPEFDWRQSIRDIFKKATLSSKTIPKPAPTDGQKKSSSVGAASGKPNNGKPQTGSTVSMSQSSSQTTAPAAVTGTASSPQKPIPLKRHKSPVEESPKPESSSTEKVLDPIESKESWSKLLGKRVVPKCKYSDDCQMLVTKKAGVNCVCALPPFLLLRRNNVFPCLSVPVHIPFMSFFTCARPLGPSGDNEVGTPFRCRTFIWSSDWSGRQ